MRCFVFTFQAICSFCVAIAQPDVAAEKGLKDYYQGYFPMGVALSPRSIQQADTALILEHFNSITAENVMKMGPIHPEENRYDWGPADALVDFAQANGMRMRGHALCWHQQTPNWLFTDSKGDTVSREVLLARLKEHITSVVSRYKGKIYAWDVVNEAISDEPAQMYRTSPWFKICGEMFIAKAFEYAHAADPEAKLFYNDYNTESPSKRDHIFQMIKTLIDAGVPIHGMGLQGHWSLTSPDDSSLEASIAKFSSLGIEVQVTELDVSVYPQEKGRRDRRPDESDMFTAEMEEKQMRQYQTIFEVLRRHKDVITGVTFWNVSDRHSWLDNFPVRGRKNYPLLFDQNLQPKKAYRRVVDF
jgi:endo-1,4-beta-xylanase